MTRARTLLASVVALAAVALPLATAAPASASATAHARLAEQPWDCYQWFDFYVKSTGDYEFAEFVYDTCVGSA